MTDILSMINRLQDTAIDFTLSGRERDREELHAARRAIMEREAELVKALERIGALEFKHDTNGYLIEQAQAIARRALRSSQQNT